MKGSIRERSPGRWAIILEQRDAATGKRKRKWHSFAGTKRQAQVECARLISEMKGGTYLEPSKTTVAQFLDRWLEHMTSQVSPKSHARYGELAKKNITPLLGAVVLTQLRPALISAAYSKALNEGRRDGKGGLSPQTVTHMHRVLKQAIGQAVKWELLNRNPVDAVDPPKAARGLMQTYDLDQTAELIEAMRPTRMFVPTLLAVLCGMRRGEVAALRWKNVDLVSGQLAILESAEQVGSKVRYKTPKSGKGRTLALSASLVEELRAHRLRQAEELLKVGVRLSDSTFVVAQADGTPLQPDTLTQDWFRKLAGTALPRIRFHDLRHAHATHLLANGIHPKVASERLGHSKIGITLDLYSHVLPGMEADAAERVDAALQLAINRRTKTVG
ncbi:MAG: tyrosine-type recombinase/integrase [Bradyrhizobium sp.]|uniref:tyrosine-type recombinase/integrase n=1 Tax=Bradyrhizobium sp. TaxID=376 RepID=UPI00271CCE20|nr:tyrosine-type recombinase/integrase [Bradyrhizobium sp.]MDO8398915.1 tyrosine-type recombinase/integrase [Bradyrhizobium sp.]